MKMHKLSNGCVINLESIATITKPIKHNPYSKNYGEKYTIILNSGCKYEVYDSALESAPLMEASILKYSELMEIIGLKCLL